MEVDKNYIGINILRINKVFGKDNPVGSYLFIRHTIKEGLSEETKNKYLFHYNTEYLTDIKREGEIVFSIIIKSEPCLKHVHPTLNTFIGILNNKSKRLRENVVSLWRATQRFLGFKRTNEKLKFSPDKNQNILTKPLSEHNSYFSPHNPKEVGETILYKEYDDNGDLLTIESTTKLA